MFLFDSMIILTKLNTKRSSVTGPVGDYKFKEKCHMRHVEMVNDREETDGRCSSISSIVLISQWLKCVQDFYKVLKNLTFEN